MQIRLRQFAAPTLLLLALSCIPAAAADVPRLISFQGVVASDGTAYTGQAYGKFALVDGAGTVLWSNDGSSGQPATAVPLTCARGIFQVLLGDTALTGMTAAPDPALFDRTDVRLRMWLSTDGSAFAQIAPDARLSTAAWAMRAQTAVRVDAGAVTAVSLAAGAVTDAAVTDVGWTKVTGRPTTLAGYGITDAASATAAADAAHLTTGTVPAARLPAMGGANGTVAGTQGAVPAPAAADNGKFLRGDGTWASAAGGSGDAADLTTGTLAAGRLPAFTGDVATSAGSSATTLAASGVTAGSYGSASAVPVLTVDAKGRVTAATTAALGTAAAANLPATGDAAAGEVVTGGDSRLGDTRIPRGSAGGDLNGTFPNPSLAASGATAGSYGSATAVPALTIDAKGRVTAAAATAIAIGAAQVASGTLAAARLPAMTGADGTVAGAQGAVPAPAATDNGKFLRGDGTWAAPAGGGSTNASDLTSGTLAAARLPALTGDVATSAGSSATTLATSGVTAGSYGSAATVPAITVDAKGRVTAAAGTAIAIAGSQVASGTVPAARLPTLVGDSGSGGTQGAVPAPAAGDAAAGKFLKADGTWTAPAAGGGGSGTAVTEQVRAYLGSNTSLPVGTMVKLPFNTTTANVGGQLNTTNNTVTITAAGLYAIDVNLVSTRLGMDEYYLVSLYKGGSKIYDSACMWPPTAGTQSMVGTLHYVGRFAASDQLTFYGCCTLTNSGASTAASGTSDLKTVLSIQRLDDTGAGGSAGMSGANGSSAGTAGTVPAPAASDNTKFLRGDGTWSDVTLPRLTLRTVVQACATSGSYTINGNTDVYILDGGGAPNPVHTVALPSAPADGKDVTISHVRVSAFTNSWTLNAGSGDTLWMSNTSYPNATTSFTNTVARVRVVYDAANHIWYQIQ